MNYQTKVNVAITPEMAMTLHAVVEAGEYTSMSEVMREAFREWKNKREQREKAVQELGKQWDIGLASGVSSDGEDAFSRIVKRLDDKISVRII
jgi:antitoxin ParD1/3/4